MPANAVLGLETWIVSYQQVPTSEDLEVLSGIAAEVHGFEHLPAAVVVLDPLNLGILTDLPGVLSVRPNEVYEPALSGSTATMGATEAWDLGWDGTGIGIAVVDTGIDGTHPDLCADELFCVNGEPVKTVQNVKILGRESRAEPVFYLEDQLNTDTSSGHGSHVAGIAGGNGSASQSEPYLYRGVAPGSHLVGLGTGDAVEAVNVLAAFDWILDNHETYNIKVVNNSWGPGKGTPYEPGHPVNRAVDAMFAEGIVTTFGAGNDGPTTDTMNAFSVHPQAISVAGGTKEGHIAFFSSRGIPGDELWRPDVTAPGYMIDAPRASTGFYGDIGDLGSANVIAPEDEPYYATNSGTSMASPHVAGVVALMQQAAFEARGSYLTPTEVLDVLERTAVRNGNGGPGGLPNYQSYTMGAGYVNALAAAQAAAAGTDLGTWDDGVTYQTGTFAKQVPAGTLLTAGYVDVTFPVAAGAISLDVMMDWTVPVNDLDIELYRPNGTLARSTFLGCAPANEPNGYSSFCTNIANERITVTSPVAGTWRARLKGAIANLPEAVKGTWSVAYPDGFAATREPAASLTLTANVPLQVMGQPVDLTATALDASGNPVASAPVTWTTEGVGTLPFGEATTHSTGWAMGRAEAVSGLGFQTVTATVDGVSASTQILWIGVPELLPDPDPEEPQNTPGEVSGGGWVDDGTKVNFGLHAEFHAGNDAASGELSVTDHDGTKTRAAGVRYVVIDGNSAWIQGPATVNGMSGYTFTLEVTDNGSPGGGSDAWHLVVTNGSGYHDEMNAVLGGGNIEVSPG
jgi:serine protease AprX